MGEFQSKSVEFDGGRVTIEAVDQRARARVITLLCLPLVLVRACGPSSGSLGVLLAAASGIVAIVLWLRAARRTIELDPTARQIRVHTRGSSLMSESLVIGFDDVQRSTTVAINDALLWNLDTEHLSLTLCVVRDEYDAGRLAAVLRTHWPSRTPPAARGNAHRPH